MDDRVAKIKSIEIGVFAQGQILCISPNGLQTGHCDAISRHFRSIHNFFFTKWLPAAILDDRKSLSIAFLAISDQYATLFFKIAAGSHFG